MRDEATHSQIAGFIVALRVKGETVDEIVGMARTAMSLATPIEVTDPASLLDVVGTYHAPPKLTFVGNDMRVPGILVQWNGTKEALLSATKS